VTIHIPNNIIKMNHFKLFEDFVNEKTQMTAKTWSSLDFDARLDSLLGAIKDPDDAQNWVEMEWIDLPSWLTSNLYESIYDVVGRKQLKIVIEGEPVEKDQEKIMKLINRADPDHQVKFYPATGKIVGSITKVKLEAITRDMRSISPDIKIKEKK
jgi:hypothetical protein